MVIGKISIKPTDHYLLYHADVSWDLVVKTILSPKKSRLNKRKGKDRYTYIKYFKEYIIELHVKKDRVEDIIWVINAFKMER
ncbi:MAG: hypothetical protein Q8L34_06730 [Candidatus Woesearchaeota archaeon]|nr:hypothetical protein [Candidatus Woesearchaeota archaeon]